MEGAAGYIVANLLIEACATLKNSCDWLMDGPEQNLTIEAASSLLVPLCEKLQVERLRACRAADYHLAQPWGQHWRERYRRRRRLVDDCLVGIDDIGGAQSNRSLVDRPRCL